MNRISFDTDDLTSFPLPVKNINITQSFSFNAIENQIYWTDGTTIYSTRTKDSGRNNKTVLWVATFFTTIWSRKPQEI